jgi:hypothetical protein
MSTKIKRENHTEIHYANKVVFVEENIEENSSVPFSRERKIGESEVH